MSDALSESVQRLVFMEADLARLLDESEDLADLAPVVARLIANQRQVIESLVAVAEEIAALQATSQTGSETTGVA